jgi:zinc finger SWIM domain-containing protein 3
MASQRRISEVQAFEIEAAEDSGIMPKAAHELVCRRVGGPFMSYTELLTAPPYGVYGEHGEDIF